MNKTKMKEKIKKFFSWILSECKDGKTLILLIIVMAVIYSPVWGGYLAHLLFGWKLGSVIASACLIFWAGPFTPFFPICIGITLFIKRTLDVRKKKLQKKEAKKKDNIC